MRNQEKPMGEGEDRTPLSKIAHTEVPWWPFRWMGMLVLFVVGAVVCSFITVHSYAMFGGVYALVAGLVLCIFPNRYLRALGLGLLIPLFPGGHLLFYICNQFGW